MKVAAVQPRAALGGIGSTTFLVEKIELPAKRENNIKHNLGKDQKYEFNPNSVSYTHLTLPTICSV